MERRNWDISSNRTRLDSVIALSINDGVTFGSTMFALNYYLHGDNSSAGRLAVSSLISLAITIATKFIIDHQQPAATPVFLNTHIEEI